MQRCQLIAPAKINLYLEILGHRSDGFHELAMVMQTVNLSDRVEVIPSSTQTIQVSCNHPNVPQDSKNLAYRAAELMCRTFPQSFERYGGVRIRIDKSIPVGAGLAGGSSNAAAVIVALDLLWDLGLTKIELQELGAQLGSDVPFSIAGGTMLATGRGERLAPLPDLDRIPLVLAKHRSLAVSTPWAYQTYRKNFEATYRPPGEAFQDRHHEVKSGPMVSALGQRDLPAIAHYLYNDLEKVVLPDYPAVERLRTAFAQHPQVRGTLMSGSGPTVFAIAESAEAAPEIVEAIKAHLQDPDLDFWVTDTSPAGVHLPPH